jgi:hypothetical protein
MRVGHAIDYALSNMSIRKNVYSFDFAYEHWFVRYVYVSYCCVLFSCLVVLYRPKKFVKMHQDKKWKQRNACSPSK